MKHWGSILALALAACSVPQSQLPLNTETPVAPTSTHQMIEVTRVVQMEQTVVVTVTPMPLLAQECFDQAITQSDLNGCAAQERFDAQAELDDTISRIEFSEEGKQKFDVLQQEWQNLVERTCMFYYDEWGSMRPMQQSMCIAARIKERIKELEITYLTPDG